MSQMPMLATPGSAMILTSKLWAFEGKWDGYRMIVRSDGDGSVVLQARSGRIVTDDFPELAHLGEALTGYRVVLDGEIVIVDDRGVPSFELLHNRVGRPRFWAFDILSLDGRDVTRATYDDRRTLLETLALCTDIIVPPRLGGSGAEAVSYARQNGWEGVVAKRRDSRYRDGRSTSWVKHKNWNTQEVVIGGWFTGERQIGALLMGIPNGDKLDYVGRVGSGFKERDLARLKRILTPSESPFATAVPDDGVTYVKPIHVAEVKFGKWTSDGRLRHPVWRGLRTDKTASEVIREKVCP